MGDRPKIAISFSGGRTSAVMTKILVDELSDSHDLSIAFANTGCEHRATLDFIRDCQEAFGWNVAWVEADIDPRSGKGIGFRIVNYETASRNGEPFEAAVRKYGIFNATAKSCTTKLKELPLVAYRASIGFTRGKALNHDTAIGIRADEADRMSARKREFRFIYPLVQKGVTKRDVAIEIKSWGFDLQIPGDHYGNCTWCWKKSQRKLYTLAIESPEVFDFPARMERECGDIKAGPEYKAAKDGRRYWFRGHKSVADIISEANSTDFTPYTDDAYDHAYDFGLDSADGDCGDSCEPFGADYCDSELVESEASDG